MFGSTTDLKESGLHDHPHHLGQRGGRAFRVKISSDEIEIEIVKKLTVRR